MVLEGVHSAAATLFPFRPCSRLSRWPLSLASRAVVPCTRRSVSVACPTQPACTLLCGHPRGPAARPSVAAGLGLPPTVSRHAGDAARAFPARAAAATAAPRRPRNRLGGSGGSCSGTQGAPPPLGAVRPALNPWLLGCGSSLLALALHLYYLRGTDRRGRECMTCNATARGLPSTTSLPSCARSPLSRPPTGNLAPASLPASLPSPTPSTPLRRN